MELSDDILNRLRDYAANLMSVTDIAVLLDLDPDELREAISDKYHPAYKFYRRGKAETIFAIRELEIELAKTASPAAISNIGHYLTDMQADEQE